MERGFDALQHGRGPILVVVSALLLILIIFAGGYFMMLFERRYRETHPEENRPKPPDAPTKP